MPSSFQHKDRPNLYLPYRTIQQNTCHVLPSWFLFVPSDNFLCRITAATLLGDLRYLSLYIKEILQETSLRDYRPHKSSHLRQPHSRHFQWTLLFPLQQVPSAQYKIRYKIILYFGLFKFISQTFVNHHVAA